MNKLIYFAVFFLLFSASFSQRLRGTKDGGRDQPPPPPPPPPIESHFIPLKDMVRSIDGVSPNFNSSGLGANGQVLARRGQANYQDGISIPQNGPNARRVSNVIGRERGALQTSQ